MLKVYIHSGLLSTRNLGNQLAVLDIAYAKRAFLADYLVAMNIKGAGEVPPDTVTELQAILMLAMSFWGSTTEMPCPHCGTIDIHYWRSKELRWKCKGCGSTFSVTSGTLLADRKLPVKKILKVAISWVNGAAGKPALQLMRDWRVAYGTVFTLGHKLREGVTRGFNAGVLAGVYQMDGLDILGRDSARKRNKPQVRKPTGKSQFPVHLLKPEVAAELMGPEKPIKHDKKMRQPEARRNLLVMRLKGVSKGLGAIATFVGVAITENSKVCRGLGLEACIRGVGLHD